MIDSERRIGTAVSKVPMLYTPVVKNEKLNAYSTSPANLGYQNKHTASVQYSTGANHNSLLYQKSVNRTE